MKKICQFCGKEFEARSNSQKYCDDDHFMTCPVCGNQYVVKDHTKLGHPTVACSYQCRQVLREQTSLRRYGIKTPGATAEARAKAKATMLEKYGGATTLQSDELRKQIQNTIRKQPDKIEDVMRRARETQKKNWIKQIRKEFPFKPAEIEPGPVFRIEEKGMQVFVLRDEASVAFLKHYGHRINPTFGKKHLSVGLAKDGILYQVLRFESKYGHIILADFGTRGNYINPNNYSLLLKEAINTVGIEEFECVIPRKLATPELVRSLSVQLVEYGMYDVYWIIESKLKKLTIRDDIIDMKQKYHYVTSDYLDKYEYIATQPEGGGEPTASNQIKKRLID